MDFVAPRYSYVSPLARKLFAIDGVKRVFYGPDYISVAKKEELEWSVIFLIILTLGVLNNIKKSCLSPRFSLF